MYSLDVKGLNEMHSLIQELKARLQPYNISDGEGHNRVLHSDREKNVILKICIAGM